MSLDHLNAPPEGPAARVVYVPAYSGAGIPAEDEIDLPELWDILWRRRWFLLLFPLTATLVAALLTIFVIPSIYRAEAVLLPTEQQGSSARMAGLAGLAGGLLPFDLPGGSKSDHIVSFLRSRDLERRLIEKYELLPHYHAKNWDETQKKWLVDEPPTLVMALQTNLLRDIFEVTQDRAGTLISLAWQDQDPAFTALMLQRVVAELQHFLEHEYETDAKREREFIERQLADVTRELEHWEQQVPSQELTLARIQRERLANETVYTELRKQLELAKISEAKEVIRFKVLDPPFVPEQRFKPKRTLICAFTLVATGTLALILAFAHHAWLNVRRRRDKVEGPVE